MTLEERAEEYKESKRHKSFREDVGTVQINYESYLNNLKQAHKDGAKENGIIWHDLRKDPDDLPKVGVQVFSEQGTLVIYKGDGFNWVEYSPNADNIKLRKWEEPIAWCEIPQFKE